MANRYVYKSVEQGNLYVKNVNVEFQWASGFAISQKQKNIDSIHNEYLKKYPNDKVLEISSKSKNPLGVQLSAFNLSFKDAKGDIHTVEAAYQSSKKFKNGGPYRDIYYMDSRSAKKDERLKNSGELVAFEFPTNFLWPLEPKTLFYDWLYINTLHRNKDLAKEILNYDAFTDIEFNPNKAINCQAKSAALYVSLVKRGLIDMVISKDRNKYIEFMQKIMR